MAKKIDIKEALRNAVKDSIERVAGRSWYEVKAQGNTSAEVLIYDEIGMWGITAKDFAEDIKALGNIKHINLRINSPGGSVSDGTAIYNTLRNHPARVTVDIDGIALSMGSIIAMAGDHIAMAENALMMIHNPWGGAIGDAEEMRKTADIMDKFKKALVSAYTKKTGLSDEEISEMMDNETWMNADEALEYGFIDEVGSQVDLAAAASFDLSKFRNAPEYLQSSVSPGTHEDKTMVDKVKGDPSVSTEEAEAIAAKARTQALADEAKRCQDIRGVFAPYKGEYADLLDVCLSDQTVSVEGARKALLDKIGSERTPSGSPHIEVVKDVRDAFRAGAMEAMEIRSGVKANDGKNEFTGFTLLDLARKSLEIGGVNTAGMRKMDVAGAAFTHSSSDFPYLLENTLGKELRRAYGVYPETWRSIADVGSVPDFKVNSRIQLGSFNSLDEIKEGGEYTEGSFSEEKETIQAVTKGKLISFTRQSIINDDLGGFMRIAGMMGRAAQRTIGNDVWGVITANAAMADGIAIFHASHSNLAGSGGAPTVTTVGAARSAMRLQQDLNGNDYLNIMPAIIAGPVALEDTLNVLMASETDPSQANSKKPNSVRNAARVITDPRLDANSTTAWYMFADPTIVPVVEVAFLDGNDQPYLESQNGFTIDGVRWKVRLDYGVDSIDFRGGYKNAGA